MLHGASILQTKLTPPHPRRHTLVRARVDALLRESLDYRVTILQASTGYGKSTALAHFAAQGVPLYWYSVGEGDSDPQQFIAHLIAAFQIRLPGLPEIPFALWQENVSAKTIIAQFLNAIDQAIIFPALIVIDDYHLAASGEVNGLLDYFLTFLPRDLHAIVATRYTPTFEHLVDWRAKGDVLEIKRDALAFTPGEIAMLFSEKYQLTLSVSDVSLLSERTEGWPIALQLVWQGMRGKTSQDISTILGHGSPSLDTLFAYLARNVLLQQSHDVQDFLLQTSILREFDNAACQAVTEHESQSILARLSEHDLFIVEMGNEHYRYHHLFQEFLRDQAQRQNADAVDQCQIRAGEFYRRAENYDEAMYHFLSADQFDQAVAIIELIGENILRMGRLDTMAIWLDAIPPTQVTTHPMLMFLLGEISRLHSRFDDGLAWYIQAEHSWRSTNNRQGVSRALRGQALVYLDTVRPAQAEALLQEALRLTEGLDGRSTQARMFELLAENKLNMGKADEAEQLRLQAQSLREEGPSEDALSVRVKLRTGRLDEARNILEAWAIKERGQMHVQRAHRETLLILSLINSIEGRAEDALRVAIDAKSLAEQMCSPYVMAASQLRLGHAYQVCGELPRALQCYKAGIELGDQIAVRRTRAEAQLGMTRVYGLMGDLDSAQSAADEGIEVANTAGDLWLETLIQLSMSANMIHAHREYESIERLENALAAFRSCGDLLGIATTQMWLAFAHWRMQHRERALTYLDQSLALAQAQHYDFLYARRTLFGMDDPRAMVPLLIQARQRSAVKIYAKSLLADLGLESVTTHPGYQLRIQTLGAFRIWHGAVEVTQKWRRLKARELFQFLITQRGKMMQRDEIIETLWRDQSPTSASGNFKVALNALNKMIEPERNMEQESSFIVRDEAAYGLRAGADIWIDADEFEQLISQADGATDETALELYRRALTLYQGDYLDVDARYADWANIERERLLMLYLRTADHLAEGLLAHNQIDECLDWCERILLRDCCWEHAYQLMMSIHALRRDRYQINRTFERCQQSLREHLDVEPSSITIEAWKQALVQTKTPMI